MPDTAALQIINLNIDSIQLEMAGCKTNIKQEIHTVIKGCTNTGAGVNTMQDINGQNNQSNTIKSINYFFSLANIDEDKRKSSDMIQKIHDTFGNIFNGVECFEGTFFLQLGPDSKPYQVPPQVSSVCATKTIQGGTGVPAEDGHHYPTRGRWNGAVV